VQKSAEVRSIYVQRDERVKTIADLECTVESLEQDQTESALSKGQLEQDLADTEAEITRKESELAALVPQLVTIKERETRLKQRYVSSPLYSW
jgi:chromosome segregation ATPase